MFAPYKDKLRDEVERALENVKMEVAGLESLAPECEVQVAEAIGSLTIITNELIGLLEDYLEEVG